jgi:hypothetical protein
VFGPKRLCTEQAKEKIEKKHRKGRAGGERDRDNLFSHEGPKGI